MGSGALIQQLLPLFFKVGGVIEEMVRGLVFPIAGAPVKLDYCSMYVDVMGGVVVMSDT